MLPRSGTAYRDFTTLILIASLGQELARQVLPFSEAPLAHVTLPYNATLQIELRHLIGALQNAVAAANALVHPDASPNARDHVLVIGQHPAAHAQAVHSDDRRDDESVARSGCFPRFDEQSHVAPALAIIECARLRE